MKTKPSLSVLFAFLLIFHSCSMNLFYRPSVYTQTEIREFRESNFGIEIPYMTSSGEQTAFYYSYGNATGEKPEILWIAFGGIRSLALHWVKWFDQVADEKMGFLLIDYPGYGLNQGIPRARFILESSLSATEALADLLDTSRQALATRVGLLGHSLGAGTVLQYAVHLQPDRIILISPFTNMDELIAYKFGPVIGRLFNLINREDYENMTRLKELLDREPAPSVHIIHGSEDAVIPAWMGRRLARLDHEHIAYYEIRDAGHRNIIEPQLGLIRSLMRFR